MALQRRLTDDAPVEFMETHIALPDGVPYSLELDRFLPVEESEQQLKVVYVVVGFHYICCSWF